MNNLNDKSKQTATSLNQNSVQTKNEIIEVKINNSTLSPGRKLSFRPSRSLGRSKSLKKPMANLAKKSTGFSQSNS